MSIYEDDIVILLRKICALAIPTSFEASEDLNRKVIMEKLRIQKNSLYQSINDFLIAFESRNFIQSDYQLKLKASDIWNSQLEMFNQILDKRTNSLKEDCKTLHINIDYELSKLMD